MHFLELDLILDELKSSRNILDKWITKIEKGSIPGINDYGDEEAQDRYWGGLMKEVLLASGKCENLVNNLSISINSQR